MDHRGNDTSGRQLSRSSSYDASAKIVSLQNAHRLRRIQADSRSAILTKYTMLPSYLDASTEFSPLGGYKICIHYARAESLISNLRL